MGKGHVAWVAALSLWWTACTGQIATTGDPAQSQPLPDGGVAPGTPLPAVSVARRLSRAELDRVLEALLGDDSAPATRLLPEDPFSPYDNDYAGQVASGALIDAIAVMARDVAARVLSDAALRDALLPCTPAAPEDEACFLQLVESLVPRAMRRPLQDGEAARYLPLLAFAGEDLPPADDGIAPGFDTAVALLIEALLQDPEFLYRVEHGDSGEAGEIVELDAHEIATRMAFLLWATTPDTALRAAADSGALLDGDGRRAQAEVMLDDPRARRQVQRFHAMWLGYRAIPHGPELAAAFSAETAALLDRVIFEEDLPYLRLFTFDETYLDDMLATHYGLPAPEGGEGWVPYGDSGRAGLLSHGSFLSAFGKFSDTSPTQRGILVRTRLMCEPLRSPPADVNADQPPGGMDADACKYERYAAHRESSACAGCHDATDPIGFGLENYDLAGRYRSHDDGRPECTIDGVGALPPLGSFSGPAQLGQLLVDGGELDGCMVRQLVQFATGHPPTGDDEPAIAELLSLFRGGDHSVRALLLAYVATDRFGQRREPAADFGTPEAP